MDQLGPGVLIENLVAFTGMLISFFAAGAIEE